MQNNFFGADRNFRRYGSTSSNEASSDLNVLFEVAQRFAAEYQNAFQVAIATLELDFHHNVPSPKKVLLLRYPDPETGKVYVSVYLPYKSEVIIKHVNLGNSIYQYLNHPNNQPIIAQAFGEASDTKSTIALGLVEPFPIDYNDLSRCREIINHLLNAADNRAEFERIHSAKEAADVKKMLPDFVEAERVGNEFKVDYTFDAAPIADVFGQPVRNDITLTLSSIPHSSRQSTLSMMLDPVELITVSGYIDFRYMPEQSAPDRPWVPDTPYYIPEFVVTDIRYVIQCGTVLVPPTLAALMVSSFMRAGLWSKKFESMYGTQTWSDFAALQRIKGDYPSAPGFAQTLNEMIGRGHLISFDMLMNPTVNDTLSMWAEAAKGKHEVTTLIVDCASLMLNGNMGAEFTRASFMQKPWRIGSLSNTLVQIGTFQETEDDKAVKHDTREIDFLAALNHSHLTVDDANRYQDSQFAPQMKSRGYATSPMQRAEHDSFRAKTQEQLAQTTITYHNAAARLTLSAGFMQVLQGLMDHGPVRFEMMGVKQTRPTITHDLINDALMG
jgi:hypothetical protein